jgi:hypothetical protein
MGLVVRGLSRAAMAWGVSELDFEVDVRDVVPELVI